MCNRFLVLAFLLGSILFSGHDAHAVIKAELPLSAMVTYNYILVGKVEKFFPDKPAMLVTVTEDIRGKAPFRQMPINCKVDDPETFKKNEIEPLMKRLGPDLEIVFFIKTFGKKHTTFAFTNGTWFQIQGTQEGENKVVFALVSAEPYFRKAFKGTTPDLRKLLKDYAAGKATLPAFDDKVEKGFGPEYLPKQKAGLSKPGEPSRVSDRVALPFAPSLTPPVTPPDPLRGSARLLASVTPPDPLRDSARLLPSVTPPDPLRGSARLLRDLLFTPASPGSTFAVIPTVGIGAPLFLLALLFPTVFGGVFVLFRQWMAFITLISINSTLMLLHMWLAPLWLRGTWWNTDAALWIVMTLATFACTLWAWRRQLNFLYSGDPEASPKTEHLVLWFMTASCLSAAVLMWIFAKPSWLEVGWALTVVMTVGIAAGTLYKLVRALRSAPLFGSPSLATEGVILGTMLLGHLAFASSILGGSLSTEGLVKVDDKAAVLTTAIAPVVKKWDFTMKENGLYVSAPLLDGDLIYTAAAHPTFRGATMVCLDRHTGVQKWEFIDDGDFKQVISSPCLAQGRLYFGEGFHDDPKCKIYCLDAATGKKLWDFQTKGQTESSPAVFGGKVYIGAGNDGIYCLDAKDGKQLWKFPDAKYRGRLLRFGAGMLAVGNRLYCGTGVDRNQKDDKGETAVFSIDATTGKLRWKAPVPYPVWSTPVLKDGMVYVATGNGDIFTDEPTEADRGGAILRLDEKTGKEVWRYNVKNGILEKPAVDAHRVYFGCRDKRVYCVGRSDGKLRWQRFLDTPVIATPVLDSDPVYERTVSVFAAATGGKVCCLNPQTGDIVWTYDLSQQQAHISASPRLVVTRTLEGYRRQLYFGAGLGGGDVNISANRPVFYCLEDQLKVD